MAISGSVQFSGRLRYAAPVPNVDSSANPTILSDVLETLVCSAVEVGVYTLVADGDTVVSLGSLSSFGAWAVKVTPNVGIPPSPGFPNGVPAAPNPVVVKLTGPAGASQAIGVDGFAFVLATSVPYTAMSIVRAPGIQTVVRVQLFAPGS